MPSKSSRSRPQKGARCRAAIYARKSSEEGLEQDFNSLDAQREACEAYIKSQKHEGWIPIKTRYDDGGFSGGKMERPALTRLLDDINAGQVDTVVVYKVDRLTRSLRDFAQIVDVFDRHEVSFVAVTQQFNTTTSMGRLTLNMLLSFAQFEREVTGERIRDKIAASKKKGMWMGGYPPLGYDVKDRKLVINHTQADVVREIFRRYVRLRTVRSLKASLDADGLVTKIRTNQYGKRTGGVPFSRGGLYKLLQNRLFRGEIVHKGQAYPGEHAPIIDEQLWAQVEATLAENRVDRDRGAEASEPSLLKGLVYDDTGTRMTPTHAMRRGRRYRYYVSKDLITGPRSESPDGWRIPARDLERLVCNRVMRFLTDQPEVLSALEPIEPNIKRALEFAKRLSELGARWDEMPGSRRRSLIRAAITRVKIQPDLILMALDPHRLLAANTDSVRKTAQHRESLPESRQQESEHSVTLTIPSTLKRAGMEMRLVVDGIDKGARPQPDHAMHRLLGQAHRYRELLFSRPGARIGELANELGVCRAHFTRMLRVSFLAPDIVECILRDAHPVDLTAKFLSRDVELPPTWPQQRSQFRISDGA